MSYVLVGGFVVVLWALLIAWVGKVAQSRGRSALAWAPAAAAGGVFGFLLGGTIMLSAVDATDLTIGFALLTALLPLGLMIGAMVGVGLVLQKQAYGTTSRKEWPVHILQFGEGTLRIADGRVALAWPDGSRESALHQIARVEADGECVRMRMRSDEEHDYVMLPTLDGLSPAGRRQMSRQIAHRLLTHRAH